MCSFSKLMLSFKKESIFLLKVSTFTMFISTISNKISEAHFHAFYWTTPQSLFILNRLRRKLCQKFSLTRIFLQSSYLWNFFTLYSLHINKHHLCVVLINYCFRSKKESTLLLKVSLFFQFLSAPSVIKLLRLCGTISIKYRSI